MAKSIQKRLRALDSKLPCFPVQHPRLYLAQNSIYISETINVELHRDIVLKYFNWTLCRIINAKQNVSFMQNRSHVGWAAQCLVLLSPFNYTSFFLSGAYEFSQKKAGPECLDKCGSTKDYSEEPTLPSFLPESLPNRKCILNS